MKYHGDNGKRKHIEIKTSELKIWANDTWAMSERLLFFQHLHIDNKKVDHLWWISPPPVPVGGRNSVRWYTLFLHLCCDAKQKDTHYMDIIRCCLLGNVISFKHAHLNQSLIKYLWYSFERNSWVISGVHSWTIFIEWHICE